MILHETSEFLPALVVHREAPILVHLVVSHLVLCKYSDS